VNLDYLQLGNGRLGSLIADEVEKHLKLKVEFARVDSNFGLMVPRLSQTKSRIKNLVICISPTKHNHWLWSELFLGMAEQVLNQEIQIEKLIMISSSRVYDGNSKGIITAQMKPQPNSVRAKQILEAEHQLKGMANSYHIIRCAGLYGGSYKKYADILRNGNKDNVFRFGVNVNQVAQQVVESLKSDVGTCRILLLTDGYGYLNGYKRPFNEIEVFSDKMRLLKNSSSECRV